MEKISEDELKRKFCELNKRLAQKRELFTGICTDEKGNTYYVYNGKDVGKERYEELMRGGR